MKKLFLSLFCVFLLAGTVLVAQDRRPRDLVTSHYAFGYQWVAYTEKGVVAGPQKFGVVRCPGPFAEVAKVLVKRNDFKRQEDLPKADVGAVLVPVFSNPTLLSSDQYESARKSGCVDIKLLN